MEHTLLLITAAVSPMLAFGFRVFRLLSNVSRERKHRGVPSPGT